MKTGNSFYIPHKSACGGIRGKRGFIMKKRLAVIAAAAVMALSMSLTAFAGSWKQDAIGWWWEEDDGSYPVSSWKMIDGIWYYFGTDGYMYANTWGQIPFTHTYDGIQMTYDEWFGVDASGAMLTSGTWEGGYLDGTDSYYRAYECGIGNNGKLWYYSGNGFHDTAYPWKNDFANKVYQTIQTNATSSGVISMDYQLPATWVNDCPAPDISNIIYMSCINAWSEFYEYRFEINNNVVHIEAWCTE